MEKNVKRDGNIDLLRIIITCGVIILHLNNSNGGGGLSIVDKDSVNLYLLSFWEATSLCAVNVFMLISGYYSCKKNSVKIGKPLLLVIEVVFFRLLFTIISFVFGIEDFQYVKLLGALLPLNYFVILYCCVYILSPYINFVINNMRKKDIKLYVTILLSVFVFFPYLIDTIQNFSGQSLRNISTISASGSSNGHSIVQFVIMYIVGAAIYVSNIQIKKLYLSLIIFISIVVVTIQVVLSVLWESDLSFATSYCNPFVVAISFSLFVLFKEMKVCGNKLIELFSKASFTVYLTHVFFVKIIDFQNIVNKPVFFMGIYIITIILVLYLIGVASHIIYSLVEKILTKIFPSKLLNISITFNRSDNQES